MKKPVIFFVLFIIFCKTLFAIPAIPYPVTFTQPNGDTLTVMVKGDERFHWHESMDGYTLLFNQDKYLTYAQLDDDGNLQPSRLIAQNMDQRDMVSRSFLNTIEKKLFFSDVQQQIMKKVWEIEEEAVTRGDRAVIGQYKTLCAFVQFSEKSFTKTMSQFEGLMNQLEYTGNGTGSVRDFFKQSSYNQFDLIITLCGIYTAPKTESYYAGNDGSQYCKELARWAAQQVAAESSINFADYDSNNDGNVDGFHFIFAGRGQEAGGGSSTIWSHKWQFTPSVTKNGKSISVYSCSPELLYSDITTIGVICHEMTHAFGAPDFYDTNYETNGEYLGTGNWDIMAGGSWNGTPGGNCPPHHNMYTKVQFGWVIPVVLSSPTTVTNMSNSAENPVAYRVNTTTNNEHYLLENRQRVKFDSSVPGDGLIIYHVHSSVGTSNINITHPQKLYPVCASSTYSVPASAPESYGNINSAGCPFPGSSNKTSFTDDSTPAMKSWAGANTGKPITNITHSNRLISFDFMGGTQTTTYTITASAGANGTIAPSGTITVNSGGSQQFIATPDDCYEVDQWTVGGTVVQTGGDIYTLSNVQANATVGVTFKTKTFMVTFSEGISDGSFTFPTYQPGFFMCGTSITYNAHSYDCLEVAYWSVDGVLVQIGGDSYTFNLQAETDIHITYKRKTFMVTPSAGSGGTISQSAPQTVTCGGNITFTATPDDCYEVDQWFVNEKPVQTGGDSYTLDNVQENAIVEVTFIIKTYTITITVGEGGTASQTGAHTVNCGESITYFFTPNYCYHIDQFFIDAVNDPIAVNDGTYTLIITEDHTIEVVFALNLYAVTFMANGGDGIIDPQGFNCGEPQTLTQNSFTKTGYKFIGWNTQEEGNGETYEDQQNITLGENLTLFAQWELLPPNQFIIMATATEGGEISPNGQIVVLEAETQLFSINPLSTLPEDDYYYRIVDVLIDDVSVGPVVEYQFENVNNNHTIHAVFEIVLGIHDPAKSNSSLYVIPNPANDYVELRIMNYELGPELNSGTDIKFYNVFGQLVKLLPCHGEINDDMLIQRISIADLSKGVYFIKAGKESAKLVKL